MNQNNDQVIQAATRVVDMVANCHQVACSEGSGGAFFGIAAMDYIAELLVATMGPDQTAEHLERLANNYRASPTTSCGHG